MMTSYDAREFFRWGYRRRLPMLYQLEAGECGLACVAMIAGYHGSDIGIRDLRSRYSISMRGISLAGVMQAAGTIGLVARPVKVRLEDLNHLSTPCILHWSFNHFVVLESVSKSSIEIHDPASGPRRLNMEQASECFTGVALELVPGASFQRTRSRPRVRLSEVIGPVQGIGRLVTEVVLLALCLELFAVIGPFFIQWIVDQAIVGADKELLMQLVAAFCLLVVFHQTVSVLRGRVLMHAGAQLSIHWGARVFSHMLTLAPSFFEKRHLGDIVSKFQSINTIQRTLTSSLVEAILDGLMCVLTLTMMIIYSPVLAAISVTVVLAYLGLRVLRKRRMLEITYQQTMAAVRQNSHLLETVRGVRSVQLFDHAAARTASWVNLLVSQVNADVRGNQLNLANRTANGLLFGIERVVVIGLAAAMVMDNRFSLGMLVAFIAYKDQFTARVSSLIEKLSELDQLKVQAERLADIVLTAGQATGSPVEASAPVWTPAISISDVSFRYASGEADVLKNISLSIEPGECVAIVGGSGSGKTTLIKVILGVLEPTEGRVMVGPPGRHDPRFRRYVGTVLQDDCLFAGTIAENIAFFSEPIDEERLQDCAKAALIHDDIAAMPMRYSTLVGDMGNVLSGGQLQRVLLARALYRQPTLLVLDEATSQLDERRERALAATIQKMPITRIVVTHYLASTEGFDRIIMIDGGSVASDRRIPREAARFPALQS